MTGDDRLDYKLVQWAVELKILRNDDNYLIAIGEDITARGGLNLQIKIIKKKTADSDFVITTIWTWGTSPSSDTYSGTCASDITPAGGVPTDYAIRT